MKLFPRVLLLALSIVFVVPAFAQEEEEDDIPVEQVYEPKFTLSFGARRVSDGPKVKFKNLGAMAQRSSDFGDLGRIYDDGSVDFTDKAGAEELREDGTTPIGDTAGAQVTNSNGTKTIGHTDVDTGYTTYTVMSGTTVVRKFLGFKTGDTRNWSYSNDSQIVDGVGGKDVLMSTYGAESEGGSMEATSNSGTGIELQVAYALGKLGKRFEWGVTAGFSLASINAKTSGSVQSTLLKTTDRYRLQPTGSNGGTINQPAHNQPGDFDDLDDTDDNGNDNDDETAATPLKKAYTTQSFTTPGGAEIEGVWQIKGAYFTMRLGPEFRYRFGERFAVSGSAGFAGAFVGTKFIVEETIVNVTVPVKIAEENSTSDFIPGYYADLNIEYWLSERSGLYAGFGYQKFGDFEQKPLRGRTAEIDLGNSAGFRIGIMTKF